jgi:Fe2+ or Zn2+ uptake regulation protein
MPEPMLPPGFEMYHCNIMIKGICPHCKH